MKKIVVYKATIYEQIQGVYYRSYNVYYCLYQEQIEYYISSKAGMVLMTICNDEYLCLSDAIKNDFNIKTYSLNNYLFIDAILLTYEDFKVFYLYVAPKLHVKIVNLLDCILFSWE